MIRASQAFGALFLLVVFISPVCASNYTIEMNQVDDKVLVKHIIRLDSVQNLSFELPQDAFSLSSNKNYSLEGSKLALSGKNIELSYITRNLLEASDDGYYLIDREIFGFSADKAAITLNLKEGYFLEIGKVFPKPSKMETDGRQISLVWDLGAVSKGQDVAIFVTIQSSQSSSSNLAVWIVIIAIISFVGYWLYSKSYKKTRAKPSKKQKKPKTKVESKFEEVERYLVDSEKAVLYELRKADRGELWQKQLQLSTGFSKAKLSRVVRNLESRHLVEKIPFGNTNKVRLK